MSTTWKVITEAEGNNPAEIPKTPGILDKALPWRNSEGSDETAEQGANMGGMIVLLTNGSARQEVSRVAFIRRNSKHPEVSFQAQLDAEISKAKAAADTMNGLVSDGSLQ